MPNAWTGIRHYTQSTNNYGFDQNCYYCTTAALLGTDVDTLINHTEQMQQDTASAGEIVALFASVGVKVQYAEFDNEHAASHFLLQFPNNSAVGFAYTRQNGSGHMIVAARDDTAPHRVRFVDYQQQPPPVYVNMVHEPTIVRVLIFFQA